MSVNKCNCVLSTKTRVSPLEIERFSKPIIMQSFVFPHGIVLVRGEGGSLMPTHTLISLILFTANLALLTPLGLE